MLAAVLESAEGRFEAACGAAVADRTGGPIRPATNGRRLRALTAPLR